jgi:hypothetical protein
MPESDEMRSAREEPDDAIEALQREVSRSDDDERFARSQRGLKASAPEEEVSR